MQVAIKACHGFVAVIDDAGVFFSRLWCCVEMQAARKCQKPIDFYTAGESEELYTERGYVGLSEAPVPADFLARKNALENKTKRELQFPQHILQRALTITCSDAKASDESEREQLLFLMLDGAVKPTEAKPSPPKKHAKYVDVSWSLRAYVASSCVMLGVEEGGQTLELMLTALDYSDTKKLSLLFKITKDLTMRTLRCGLDDFIAEKLFGKLPTDLEELTIRYPLEDLPPNFADGKLRQLRLLDLKGSECLEIVPPKLCVLSKLKSLCLADCFSLRELPEQMYEMLSLEVLNLNRCVQLSHLPPLLGRLPKLSYLDLEDCFHLGSLPEIKTTRVMFPQLEFLNLSRCDRLTHLPSWVSSAEKRGAAVQYPSIAELEEDTED